MRRGRRLLVKLGLAVLAGAVVTWAVAYGCALRNPQPRKVRAIAVRAGDGSVLWGSQSWALGYEGWVLAPPRGLSGERARVLPPGWVYNLAGAEGTFAHGYGFPQVCLTMRLGFTLTGPGAPTQL